MSGEKPRSPLRDKSYLFAIEIVKLCQSLVTVMKEYLLSKQLLRSGTAIGALIRESEFAASKADFINKLTVSLKEANETDYWLMLLLDTNYMEENQYKKLQSACSELIAM